MSEDYAYTIFCFLGATTCFVSVYFIWRIPGRPLSSLLLLSWLFSYAVFASVDSIVWAGENLGSTPDGMGYCDVAARVKGVTPMGVLGSTIGVGRFLVHTTDVLRPRTETTARIVRRNVIDAILGIGLPILFVLLKWIVESSRYSILGVMGCQDTVDGSWLGIPLYFIWPPLFTLVAFAFIGSPPPPQA